MKRKKVALLSLLAAGALWMTSGSQPAGARPPASRKPATAAAATPSPADQLDAMDARTPVPMLPMMVNHQKENMRDHLLVVQEVLMALGANDFPAVEKSASRMGYSERMAGMCQHMGAGAPGFTERAIAFHRAADGIAEAARKKDAPGAQRALADTLVHCTGCHAAYKQKVVTPDEYQLAAQASAPTAPEMMQHHGGH